MLPKVPQVDRGRWREFFVNSSIGVVALIIGLVARNVPTGAAVDPATAPTYWAQAAGDLDQWQRIDFRSERLSVRPAPQIKVVIQTRGPALKGLIRIPGAPASNFDTGKGLTAVDLINTGDQIKGYREIVALEIVFTQAMPGQFYQVFPVDCGSRD
ncbi:hypothetical protein [Bradyrhizobium sp. CCBAU 51765]|uniref:hypothetical protein n=1 Tax=Bradyrhizobium sp. CCBAU 51765 TaxID=1325102 RepID=UPI0018870FD2|nr:hypothetical protein [Bradyrhizobium sp. CCBAU 51765]QOZ09264.1 hypothetical protein XH96_18295 [Bradyrhizobium sp. CCBAU 51765]